MPYQKASSIEEIASKAILMAMDEGVDSDEGIVKWIQNEPARDNEVGGEDPETVIELYLRDEFSAGDGGLNPEYTWPTHSGTLYEALILNAGNYIAAVAKRILREEGDRLQDDPDLEDYPIQ